MFVAFWKLLVKKIKYTFVIKCPSLEKNRSGVESIK
jgi:hypothetical protein